ncbi:site-specific recombinase XerD [Lutibacter sp. Hel_I_33_5]|uniref:tyrosine-type recombinase/integrase n=1 Tax=Lutibacter sp. Hel_I_33_5 TaxID=1566289 RepID=UPI0011A04807|nr:tyrosine-type recombinase/integrase [Lutibacter sp. Hel_I_33_5]TVZ56915.1 site-specific recombinase XerD [Lutibacter sp. Hel_I_33_5]
MKHTFYLRKPKGVNETLILFSCYFKNERKQFVYSTRQSIIPKNWDFQNNKPNNRGKDVSVNHILISRVLNQYEDEFYLFQSRSELSKTEFTSHSLKQYLDKSLGNISVNKTAFFEVYDRFTNEKIKRKEWKKSTIKRYNNIKNLLTEFEKVKRYKLTFSKIDNIFYTEFIDFCYEYKDHYTNTFNRNIGLVKTFLFWALKKEFMFNNKFINFKKPKRVLTREEALSFEDIKKLYNHDCDDSKLNKIKDVFIFQSLTGMRFGELKLINKRTVNSSDCVVLKEEKDSSKDTREIPLISISKAILLKYDYRLPLVSNQKHNDYIKEVLKDAGFVNEVEYSKTKGVEQEVFVKKFYERISTHTARRTFITIMRNKGIADKTIMSISGHKDIKTFNMYHQVNNEAKIEAVKSVFEDF